MTETTFDTLGAILGPRTLKKTICKVIRSIYYLGIPVKSQRNEAFKLNISAILESKKVSRVEKVAPDSVLTYNQRKNSALAMLIQLLKAEKKYLSKANNQY